MSKLGADTIHDRLTKRPGFTGRALVVGIILIPLNVYWVEQMEWFRYSAHPTTVSLFFNAVFTLLVLCLLNLLLHRLVPRHAFHQSELLLIYSMVCIGSAMGSHDFISVLMPVFTWSFWAATPANRWDELFNTDMPRWLTVQNHKVMEGFYEGGVSFYQGYIVTAWLVPVAMWTVFIICLVLVMFCLNVLLRKQWLANEHLACPLVALPIEISQPQGRLFRQKVFWVGFGCAAAVDIWNSLAFLYPAMPMIPMMYSDIGQNLRSPPWDVLAGYPGVRVSFFPFLIGIGYFMPSDFLFSCWFFYLFWKAELVLGALFGLANIPDFPFENFQGFGAYLLFALYAMWIGRIYFRQVYNLIVGAPSQLCDDQEPIRYRLAALGILLGLVGLVWFSLAMGIRLWVSLVFFLIYYVLALAITRMRAEFGTPVHDLHQGSPDVILPTTFGSRFFPKQDLIGIGIYRWFNRAYRSHPMPFHMEAMHMQARVGGTCTGTVQALMIATIVGIVASFWGFLHVNYSGGAISESNITGWGNDFFARIAASLTAPEGPRWGATTAIGVGLAFAVFLQVMRMRYVNWPLHPLGFAVSSKWEMGWVWMPLLLAWILKSAIIRYGGHKVYQRCMPAFIGLILGQFVVGSILNIVSIALHIPSYMFWQ